MPKQPLFDFKKAHAQARAFLDERILAFGERQPMAQRFVHFWMLVWRSFVRNRCPVRASALSYTTLLALIPLFAVVVSVTSSLLKSEGEQQIDQFIQKLVDSVTPPAMVSTNRLLPGAQASPPTPGAETTASPPIASPDAAAGADAGSAGNPAPTNSAALASLAKDERVVEARKIVSRYINGFIQNTRSGTLGAVGLVLLLWVVYSLLSRIEETLNDIWGAPRGRNWLVRILNYWAAVTLGPVVLVGGVGLASGPRFAGMRHFVESMPIIGGLVFQVLPLGMLWLAFTFFYQLMPNTKVRFSAAAVGGIIGGVLWLGTNLLGSLYVSRVVTNFKIYGGLGLVPVVMLGLYSSWVILLFGAQVAYAWQNRAAYLQEKLAENVNQRGREFVALRLMTAIGQRFQRGEKPATISAMSADLGIPSRLIQQVMQVLLSAKLVVEVAGTEIAYAPARPLEMINCHQVLVALRAGSGQEPATRDEPARAEVLGEFARIQEAERHAASSVTLLALVNRTQARLALAPPAEDVAIHSPPAIAVVAELVSPTQPELSPNHREPARPAEPAAAEMESAPKPGPALASASAPVRPSVIPDDSPFPD